MPHKFIIIKYTYRQAEKKLLIQTMTSASETAYQLSHSGMTIVQCINVILK